MCLRFWYRRRGSATPTLVQHVLLYSFAHNDAAAAAVDNETTTAIHKDGPYFRADMVLRELINKTDGWSDCYILCRGQRRYRN